MFYADFSFAKLIDGVKDLATGESDEDDDDDDDEETEVLLTLIEEPGECQLTHDGKIPLD